MALILKDRVKETTTTTGTGTVTLAGAVTGYQSFSAVGNANETYYCIAGQGTSEWEVGIGVYTSSGTTLSRATVLASSNSGSLVNFSAGTKDVFCTFPASRALPAVQYALYTSGTATWTCPTGVTQIQVVCIAGGGGGASNNNRNGGNGGLAIGIYAVTPGTGYSVTVGAGGAGTINSMTNGSSGGNSSLGSLISATGGGGGQWATGDGTAGSGSNGNLRNAVSATYAGNVGIFQGGNNSITVSGLTAAASWSISSLFSAGAGGPGLEDFGGSASAKGGIGGVIYILYVG